MAISEKERKAFEKSLFYIGYFFTTGFYYDASRNPSAEYIQNLKKPVKPDTIEIKNMCSSLPKHKRKSLKEQIWTDYTTACIEYDFEIALYETIESRRRTKLFSDVCQKALNLLSDREQMLFIYRYIENYSYSMLSSLVCLSEKAIRINLQKALNKIIAYIKSCHNVVDIYYRFIGLPVQ